MKLFAKARQDTADLGSWRWFIEWACFAPSLVEVAWPSETVSCLKRHAQSRVSLLVAMSGNCKYFNQSMFVINAFWDNSNRIWRHNFLRQSHQTIKWVLRFKVTWCGSSEFLLTKGCLSYPLLIDQDWCSDKLRPPLLKRSSLRKD